MLRYIPIIETVLLTACLRACVVAVNLEKIKL